VKHEEGISMNHPYISLDESCYGSVGFVVGFSSESGLACFVQSEERSDFSDFGGLLDHKNGMVTTIDSLIRLRMA
jgi:hypothetical protein